MNYKQKLITLLSTCEEVRKDIEESNIKHELNIIQENGDYFYDRITQNTGLDDILDLEKYKEKFDSTISELHEVPIDYHHLMQYCESNNIFFSMGAGRMQLITKDGKAAECRLKLKITDLNSQDESVYEKLYNFLQNTQK